MLENEYKLRKLLNFLNKDVVVIGKIFDITYQEKVALKREFGLRGITMFCIKTSFARRRDNTSGVCSILNSDIFLFKSHKGDILKQLYEVVELKNRLVIYFIYVERYFVTEEMYVKIASFTKEVAYLRCLEKCVSTNQLVMCNLYSSWYLLCMIIVRSKLQGL